MTLGVGGSTATIELAKIKDASQGIAPIKKEEYQKRLQKITKALKKENIKALYINAGTNLRYFTGTQWNSSERMVGALLLYTGELHYIVPKFEEGTFKKFLEIEAQIHCWEEHQSPYKLVASILANSTSSENTIAVDDSAPFFLVDGLTKILNQQPIISAADLIANCRMQKSPAEIAIIQRAKDITLSVHKAVAKILRPGISVAEVTHFINEAHKKAGIASGSYFCIVLFGEDSQYPHGVQTPQNLVENEIVLIDTGCKLLGYISDITRTYVYGTPTKRHREIWDLEKAAQKAAFNAAQLGVSCNNVDAAARKTIAAGGLDKDYALPGLPHRVGHGTGLDIHEQPYLVRGNQTTLKEGMVMSNEPMLCIPGEFGIRHEDHFYLTDKGPKWFTKPMLSIDNPFAIES